MVNLQISGLLTEQWILQSCVDGMEKEMLHQQFDALKRNFVYHMINAGQEMQQLLSFL